VQQQGIFPGQCNRRDASFKYWQSEKFREVKEIYGDSLRLLERYDTNEATAQAKLDELWQKIEDHEFTERLEPQGNFVNALFDFRYYVDRPDVTRREVLDKLALAIDELPDYLRPQAINRRSNVDEVVTRIVNEGLREAFPDFMFDL